MANLIMIMYISFTAGLVAALIFSWLYNKFMKRKLVNEALLHRRRELFESIIEESYELLLLYEQNFEDKTNNLQEKYEKIVKASIADYSLLGIDISYKRRIDSIMTSFKRLIEPSNQKLYLGEKKSKMQEIRDKLWALSDKIRTEKVFFEVKKSKR